MRNPWYPGNVVENVADVRVLVVVSLRQGVSVQRSPEAALLIYP